MSTPLRETLFISHASPEDNAFVLWLSSRLQLMGYKVWCDLEQFHGGEKDFWGRIEVPIRDESAKFLIVVSSHSMKADGVQKEFHFAEQVAKESGIQDFVLPLWVEKVPYTIRIGLSIYNKIDFEKNWAAGLNQLLEKLETDNVPRSGSIINEAFLNKIRRPANCDVLQGKKERHYSNWWSIGALPPKLYYFQYENDSQAKAIFREVRHYPVVRHGNVLVSFQQQLPALISETNPEWTIFDFSPGSTEAEIRPISLGEIDTRQIVSGYQSDVFPTTRDAENFLKRLLWKGFFLLMRKRGLPSHEMSNKADCFYFPNNHIHKNKVSIHYSPRRVKKKNLVGNQGESYWHFGISCRVQLHPIVCYNLKSHILFSDDGQKIWNDSAKLHSARRKKGRTWFNEHWRDQLMAFLTALKRHDEEYIPIELCETFTLRMAPLTKSYVADFGYWEPKSNDRQNLLSEFDELEDADVLEPLPETTNEPQ